MVAVNFGFRAAKFYVVNGFFTSIVRTEDVHVLRQHVISFI